MPPKTLNPSTDAGDFGQPTPKLCGLPIKYLALAILTMQNASQMLFMRYAKMPRVSEGRG